jgi:hypothetical protein
MVVMKGVMDHADDLKSDNIKTFAARASAECLIAFLRANLPSSGSGFEDIVEPGTSTPPSKLGPSALLNARHRFVLSLSLAAPPSSPTSGPSATPLTL